MEKFNSTLKFIQRKNVFKQKKFFSNKQNYLNETYFFFKEIKFI